MLLTCSGVLTVFMSEMSIRDDADFVSVRNADHVCVRNTGSISNRDAVSIS